MCAVAVATFLLAGCGGSETSAGGEEVVAAFYPLAFAAEQVAAPGVELDHVRVRGTGDDVDPHVWLDPVRYAQVTRAIASALGEPARAAPFVRRLSALDRELARGLRTCQRRRIVTSHAAFGYLAARYGLRQVALVGLAPAELAETVAREAGAVTATLDPLEALTPTEEGSGADYFDVMRKNLAALRQALGCR